MRVQNASAPDALRTVDENAQELFATIDDQDDVDDEVAELRGRLQDAQETIDQLQLEKERLEESDGNTEDDFGALVQHDAVQSAVDIAKDNCDRSGEHVDRVLAVLASSNGGPL
ncbi:hypothetical protein [Halostagnicola sp. A-GB9-2]|uniref:hypothetical protein n=1 Tax=Halostagnicola sp. A-GB9-2 TaxID=3048066 RepID=UPI0024C08A8E|nr:hypothetical protein [Halostagnicola sp. A-GB9-2]MDJ1433569.1 hypothetical protein [Halostagnicola sp. A-GB9-2]